MNADDLEEEEELSYDIWDYSPEDRLRWFLNRNRQLEDWIISKNLCKYDNLNDFFEEYGISKYGDLRWIIEEWVREKCNKGKHHARG